MLFINIILLILGFLSLIKGADFLVSGSSAVAKRFHVSDLVIGLTIVSFGTSSPELIVNMLSAITGNIDLALGNVVGSNISNTLLVLGVSAIVFPLVVKKGTVWREIPFAILASFTVFFLANDTLFNRHGVSAITRNDGLILLLIFGVFLYYAYRMTKNRSSQKDIPDKENHLSVLKSSLMIGFGVIGLALGGSWIVNGATAIATALNISQSVIGLTIVAIGTSLPELATSVMAAWRKNTDIAVGNIVGSNIFNLLFVLALTSTVKPLPLTSHMNIDMSVMLISAILLFLVMFVDKKNKLSRFNGIVFLILYIVYIIYLAFR